MRRRTAGPPQVRSAGQEFCPSEEAFVEPRSQKALSHQAYLHEVLIIPVTQRPGILIPSFRLPDVSGGQLARCPRSSGMLHVVQLHGRDHRKCAHGLLSAFPGSHFCAGMFAFAASCTAQPATRSIRSICSLACCSSGVMTPAPEWSGFHWSRIIPDVGVENSSGLRFEFAHD